MTAVFKRELKSYFNGPIGFVLVAIFGFFSSIFFSVFFAAGAPNVEQVITALSTIAVFATPFITMRLLSEDRRQKVDQALLTAPVSVTGIVMGKFLAALCLFAICFSFTLVFQFIVSTYVAVNWLIYLYSLFGMLLLGAAMISIGLFISSLTESPMVSAALTFAVFLLSMLLESFVTAFSDFGSGIIAQAIYKALSAIAPAISFINRLSNFNTGVFNLVDVVYLLSISAFFIFLTVRSVEKRRWA